MTNLYISYHILFVLPIELIIISLLTASPGPCSANWYLGQMKNDHDTETLHQLTPQYNNLQMYCWIFVYQINICATSSVSFIQ